MNIQQLRGFVTIAQTQSITKAGQQIHLSQQALSKSIARLEDELGGKLFVRSDGKTVLTEIGQKLLPVAESLIQKHEEHEKLMREIVRQNTHNIRIAFENSVLLNSYPADLLARIGDIRISSYLGTDGISCTRDVQTGKATCAFMGKPDNLQGLLYCEVFSRAPTVIMSKNHPLAQKDHITLQDLRNENHAWLSINTPFFQRYYKACIDAGFYPKITKEYPTVDLLHRELPNGMEITVGMGLFSTERESELARRPLDCPSCRINVGFVYRAEDTNNCNLISYFNVVKEAIEAK